MILRRALRFQRFDRIGFLGKAPALSVSRRTPGMSFLNVGSRMMTAGRRRTPRSSPLQAMSRCSEDFTALPRRTRITTNWPSWSATMNTRVSSMLSKRWQHSIRQQCGSFEAGVSTLRRPTDFRLLVCSIAVALVTDAGQHPERIRAANGHGALRHHARRRCERKRNRLRGQHSGRERVLYAFKGGTGMVTKVYFLRSIRRIRV